MSIRTGVASRCWLRAITAWSLCLVVSASQAADPSTGATKPGGATPGMLAGPPQLASLVVAGGAPRTWDPTVSLTWTASGPKATHWRVSASPSFPGTAWQPVPATPASKFNFEGLPEGPTTLHLQLMNDQGQSAVRSATIDWRVRPRLTGVTVQGAYMANNFVAATLLVAGTTHRTAMTARPQPPSTAAGWKQIPNGATGPLWNFYEMTSSEFGSNLITGQTYTVYMHVQRDDGPVDTRAASFVYTGMPTQFTFDMPGSVAPLLDALQRRGRLLTQPVSGGAKCFVSTGWPGGNNVLEATAPTLSAPSTVPARCRFTLFAGQALKPGWTLEGIEFSVGPACQVHPATLGANPSVIAEATVPVGAQNRLAQCSVKSVVLKGPWSSFISSNSAIP